MMGLRDGMWYRHPELRDIWEWYRSFSGNFLKYLNGIIMKSPNSEGDRVWADLLLSPNEASTTRIEWHLLMYVLYWISVYDKCMYLLGDCLVQMSYVHFVFQNHDVLIILSLFSCFYWKFLSKPWEK